MKLLILILIISMTLSLVATFGGVIIMGSNSKIRLKYSNKLMRIRIWLQAISVALAMIAFMTFSKNS
jgi:hypothetical protein